MENNRLRLVKTAQDRFSGLDSSDSYYDRRSARQDREMAAFVALMTSFAGRLVFWVAAMALIYWFFDLPVWGLK